MSLFIIRTVIRTAIATSLVVAVFGDIAGVPRIYCVMAVYAAMTVAGLEYDRLAERERKP